MLINPGGKGFRIPGGKFLRIDIGLKFIRISLILSFQIIALQGTVGNKILTDPIHKIAECQRKESGKDKKQDQLRINGLFLRNFVAQIDIPFPIRFEHISDISDLPLF